MSTILPLDKMTTEEKLKLVEEIWDDLLKSPDRLPIQQWHKDLLDERAQLVAEGKARYIPWEQARREIAEEIARGRPQ